MNIRTLLKRWWFWTIVIVILLIGGGVAFGMTRGEQVTYDTHTVTVGDFTQTVEVSGELESVDEVELSFDISGTLSEVLVAVGDEVEAGQILAYLETDELIADVQNAYQAVRVAQANLSQTNAGATDEAVAVAQASYDAAVISLANTQADLENTEALAATTIAVAEASLETANDTYYNTVSTNNADLSQAYEDLVNVLWAAMIEVRDGISQADEVIGVRDSTGNNEYETVLSAKNQQALTDAKTQFYGAEEARDAAEAVVFDLAFDTDGGTILDVTDLVEHALDETAELLLYVRQVADATIMGGTFTAADLSALKTTIDTSRNAIQTDRSSVLTYRHAVETAVLAQSTEAVTASNAVTEAQENVDNVMITQTNAIATKSSAVSAAEATVAVRAAELAQAQATPRSVDLAPYEAEVARTQAAYEAANARLAKAEIVSPIAGKVSDVAFETGEQVVAATRMLTVQTIDDQYRIVADVTESDISKIELGDQVYVTFDAFSDDIQVLAEVQEIDPAETLIESVVYYEIAVMFTGDVEQLTLKPGMSVDLEITTEKAMEVVTVPQRAVLTNAAGEKYVRVLEGRNYREQVVVLGTRGDLGAVIVESGLSGGEEIVLRIND